MSMIRYLKRITFIDYLIQKKGTGNLETFAIKNNVSTRTLSDIIKEMRELGFPIKYDRCKNSYVYEEEGEMIKSLFLKYGKVLDREELRQIGRVENLCFCEKAIFVPCVEEQN
jgi:hypothetical protein